MSRFGAKKGRKLPGAEFSWDTDGNGEPDTAPTPLFPKFSVPRARPLSAREQLQVDYYRGLRERYHDGPYYSILDSASTAAKKGSVARVNFDSFHGMPTYSGRYQRKKRTMPRMGGRSYIMKFFPRELWQTIQPTFKPDAAMDGYAGQFARATAKRGFEDDEEEDEEDETKRKRTGGEEEEDNEKDILEGEEEGEEEEIVDDDFEDDEDEMGGDYNAEQYFDGGDDEYGDDGFGDGGGGGGDEETY